MGQNRPKFRVHYFKKYTSSKKGHHRWLWRLWQIWAMHTLCSFSMRIMKNMCLSVGINRNEYALQKHAWPTLVSSCEFGQDFKPTSLVEVCICGTLQLEFVTFVFVCQNSQRWCRPSVEVRIQKNRPPKISASFGIFYWTKKQLTGILVELQGTGTRVPFFDLGHWNGNFLFNYYYHIFKENFESGNVAYSRLAQSTPSWCGTFRARFNIKPASIRLYW